jgi:hypothetical protein
VNEASQNFVGSRTVPPAIAPTNQFWEKTDMQQRAIINSKCFAQLYKKEKNSTSSILGQL